MIVYVLSTPTENALVLSSNRELMMQARKAASDTGQIVEMQSWDTDKSPMCVIDLNIQVIDDTKGEAT
jgi:hypothetical protein